MNCQKCGAELHPEQKVCLQCGTRTVAGGGFYVEEKEPWKPTKGMIYAAVGALVLIIILLVAKGMRTVPPETVAKEWFDAMVQRKYNVAQQYHSPQFTSKMVNGVSDTRAISDYIYEEVVNNQAQYTVQPPQYDVQAAPTSAKVIIALKGPDSDKQFELTFGKQGRRWLITDAAY